ncbi:MAG: multidrug efflux SMR transporter [Thermomicrobiales bacterium]
MPIPDVNVKSIYSCVMNETESNPQRGVALGSVIVTDGGEQEMAWVLLAIAIASEIVATTSLKQSNGFSKPAWSVLVVVGYGISFFLMSQVLKTIPVSVAYAVWSGAGTAVVAAIGMVFLGEPVSLLKVGGIAMIVAGVVALNAGGH